MKNMVLETILSRRSTRNYKADKIDEEILNEIINAGTYAPSAHNQQSWHFTVVTNRELLRKMSNETKEQTKESDDNVIRKMANNSNFDIFYKAPAAIIVSGDNSSMMPQVDCAAATQNILIAAESLDVGTCWNGFVSFIFQGEVGEKWRKELNIPENHTPYYAIGLGYKDGKTLQAPARRENRVNYIK